MVRDIRTIKKINRTVTIIELCQWIFVFLLILATPPDILYNKYITLSVVISLSFLYNINIFYSICSAGKERHIMGRGSGSHGGGGHSGGRSFGGRGAGGFGGGGAGGPGFGGPPPGGPHIPRWGGPRRGWGGPIFSGGFFGWGGPGRRGGGCSTVIILLIFVLIAFSRLGPGGGSSSDSTKVAPSRTERTAVTGTDTYGEWYLDELGFIRHDEDLTDGLKYFYSRTGIQPYVMLLEYDGSLWDNGRWNESAAEKYLAQVYKNTFTDNGHMILAYFACENDSEDMDGTFYIYYGSAAYSVMDAEAETIFWSYFDMNYNNLDLSIAEFIGTTFHETADNIMHIEGGGNGSLIKAAAIFAVICVVVIIAGIIVAKRSGRKEQEDYDSQQ